MIWLFLVFAVVLALISRIAYVRGLNAGRQAGREQELEYWEKLRKTPIAGQAVDVPGFGEVIILGRGEIDGVPHIDYIQSKVVDGRNIPDLDEDELNRNTISCPLDEFIAQCEISLKFL